MHEKCKRLKLIFQTTAIVYGRHSERTETQIINALVSWS